MKEREYFDGCAWRGNYFHLLSRFSFVIDRETFFSSFVDMQTSPFERKSRKIQMIIMLCVNLILPNVVIFITKYYQYFVLCSDEGVNEAQVCGIIVTTC